MGEGVEGGERWISVLGLWWAALGTDVFLRHEVGVWYWKGRWLNHDPPPPMKMMFDLGFAQPVGAWPPTMDSA
jgi:hypothetical protein